MAIVAILVGFGLLSLWWATGGSNVIWYAGLAGLLVALVWGIQYAVLTGRLIVTKSGGLAAPSKEQSNDGKTQEGTGEQAVAATQPRPDRDDGDDQAVAKPE